MNSINYYTWRRNCKTALFVCLKKCTKKNPLFSEAKHLCLYNHDMKNSSKWPCCPTIWNQLISPCQQQHVWTAQMSHLCVRPPRNWIAAIITVRKEIANPSGLSWNITPYLYNAVCGNNSTTIKSFTLWHKWPTVKERKPVRSSFFFLLSSSRFKNSTALHHQIFCAETLFISVLCVCVCVCQQQWEQWEKGP